MFYYSFNIAIVCTIRTKQFITLSHTFNPFSSKSSSTFRRQRFQLGYFSTLTFLVLFRSSFLVLVHRQKNQETFMACFGVPRVISVNKKLNDEKFMRDDEKLQETFY